MLALRLLGGRASYAARSPQDTNPEGTMAEDPAQNTADADASNLDAVVGAESLLRDKRADCHGRTGPLQKRSP